MNEKYDLICVFHPNTTDEKIDAALARVQKKITSEAGTIENLKKIGLRKVHTRMRKYKTIRDGYYVEINFTAEKNIPQEISTILRVNEDLMRFILTKAIKIVEIPEEKPVDEKVEINPEMLIGKPE